MTLNKNEMHKLFGLFQAAWTASNPHAAQVVRIKARLTPRDLEIVSSQSMNLPACGSAGFRQAIKQSVGVRHGTTPELAPAGIREQDGKLHKRNGPIAS